MWKARITLIGEKVRKIEITAEDIYGLLDLVMDQIIPTELKQIEIYKEEV